MQLVDVRGSTLSKKPVLMFCSVFVKSRLEFIHTLYMYFSQFRPPKKTESSRRQERGTKAVNQDL